MTNKLAICAFTLKDEAGAVDLSKLSGHYEAKKPRRADGYAQR